mgnify:CR=1 FL=1
MEPIHLRLEHEEQFGAWAEVGKPVGAVPPQVRTALEKDLPQADMGFWECTVGSFERQHVFCRQHPWRVGHRRNRAQNLCDFQISPIKKHRRHGN